MCLNCSRVLRMTRLQGKLKGACSRKQYGAGQRWLRCMNRTRSSKLKLAYLHLWLLTHLQSNMFVHSRLFLLSAEPNAKFRHAYISSLSPSAR
ncbi:hypothetical protein BU25DRAFT_59037 [Macroventuria anomochaeta]|uniref:Uncharacterized protein n=1 Tax=Macroventuria anomochaeta TaxID=301207 RepID=A0ACB6S174_9PLEO|nr:uncharacterized protein BU25DRAFT_59037 [Macroventuria anomochaeta]KAF2627703.1 hypothetical protein BU25DRAFT_59037 [Macroventuria anomochaeta]